MRFASQAARDPNADRGEPSRVSRVTHRSLGCPQFLGLGTPAKTSNVGVRQATLTCCRLQRSAARRVRSMPGTRPIQEYNASRTSLDTDRRETPWCGLADCGLHAEGERKGSSSSSSSRVTESKLLCSCSSSCSCFFGSCLARCVPTILPWTARSDLPGSTVNLPPLMRACVTIRPPDLQTDTDQPDRQGHNGLLRADNEQASLFSPGLPHNQDPAREPATRQLRATR